MKTSLPPFPPKADFVSFPIMRQLARAERAIGTLRGSVHRLPNPQILLNTLSLQEAQASSEIENIVTTQDEAFRLEMGDKGGTPEAKEVARYRQAMGVGYEAWKKDRCIRESTLVEMFRVLKQHSGGYRDTPGTVLRDGAGRVVYTPPQDKAEINRLMGELAEFVNAAPSEDRASPLIDMALIHYRFESIHPFPDGNGRIGRILNVLYLIHTEVLEMPILYLSRGINRTKGRYYECLRAIQDGEEGSWEHWVEYMLTTVTDTAADAAKTIIAISDLMADYKMRMRRDLPDKMYSKELLESMFYHPYTRIAHVEEALGVQRAAASKYLQQLAAHGFVTEKRHGRSVYYINEPLVNLFAPEHEQSHS